MTPAALPTRMASVLDMSEIGFFFLRARVCVRVLALVIKRDELKTRAFSDFFPPFFNSLVLSCSTKSLHSPITLFLKLRES